MKENILYLKNNYWLQLLILVVAALFYSPSCFSKLEDTKKGITSELIAQETVAAYEGSYALLIGINDYTKGWPDLESIPGELDKLETALRYKGFNITRLNNPDSLGLNNGIKTFIDQYGYDENNRLLFYFSGHGYSLDSNRKGYLVPNDAPLPEEDSKGFKQKALNMNQIISWSRQMDAKHALFLFDSCFSGTIFKERAFSEKPKIISEWTKQPVRQFITAGKAGETVPANSTFTPAFINAISGEADFNNDGYIIGTEVGLYLQQVVPQYVDQTPQYGKINDYELSRGDFVFFRNPDEQNFISNASSFTPVIPRPKNASSTKWYKRWYVWAIGAVTTGFILSKCTLGEGASPGEAGNAMGCSW